MCCGCNEDKYVILWKNFFYFRGIGVVVCFIKNPEKFKYLHFYYYGAEDRRVLLDTGTRFRCLSYCNHYSIRLAWSLTGKRWHMCLRVFVTRKQVLCRVPYLLRWLYALG